MCIRDSYKDTVKKLIPYSDQDYDSIMTSVINSIPVLTPEYNDVSETDMGMTILEESAKIADVLSWKADIAMNEALPGNARSRKAALIQCKWLSYKPKQNLSSTANQKITLTNNGDVFTVPKGVKFSTGNGRDDLIFEAKKSYVFEAPNEMEIPIGEDYDVFIDIISGESVEEYLGVSDGLVNQRFTITKTPFINGSIFLEVLDEISNTITIYEESDYLFDIGYNENKFIIRFDEVGYGIIEFGDGVNGNIPKEGSVILAKYMIGGGSNTNLSAGMINTLLDSFDNRIVSTTNVSDAVGGSDEESVASINANAHSVFRTRNRLVSSDDCILWGRGKANVDDAWFEKDEGYVDLYYLYLLPSDRNKIGLEDDYKIELKEEVDRLCMLGDDIRIEDPVWKDVSVGVEVTVDPAYDDSVVLAGVFHEVKELINLKKFGEALSISDIYSSVGSVDGIGRINLTELCDKGNSCVGDIICNKKEVVRLEYDDDIQISLM